MKCAWVLVIWGHPKYIIGALAAAQSLRMVKTKHKIVLLYANMDLSKFKLTPLFDEVKKVPLLEFEYKDLRTERQKQLYGGEYSKQINTKWQVLSLTKYDKVIYIDADIVFRKNSDEIFDLDCPAATFSNAYARPYNPTGIPNIYGMLKHGDQIPPSKVIAALNGSFSGCGALYLLKPDIKMLDEYIKWMRAHEPYGNENSYSGIDEQSICEFYAYKKHTWTHIHQKYQLIPWKQNWWPQSKDILRDAYGLHYYHDKPWEKGEGANWPDVKIWWDAYHAFEKQYPDMAKSVRPYITFYSKGGSKKKTKKSTKKKKI